MPEAEQGKVVHRLDPKGRIQVDVVQGSVHVHAVDADEASVIGRYPSRSDRGGQDPIADGVLRVTEVDGGLVITTKRARAAGGFLDRFVTGGAPPVDVTINAPRDATLAATSVGADITTKGMLHEQSIRTVNGDVTITGASGAVEIQSVSGGIDIEGGILAPRLSTTSGDMALRADRIRSTRIDSVSGDVTVEGRLDPTGEHRVNTINGDLALRTPSGATISMRGVSGSIRTEGAARRQDDGKGHRRVVVGDGLIEFAFQTVSGDLLIRTAAPEGEAGTRSDEAEAMRTLLEALERGEIDVDEASRRLEVTHG